MYFRPRTISSLNSYVSLIRQCIAEEQLNLGKALQSHLLKTALSKHTIIANHLINMYSKLSFTQCALNIFNELPIKNTQSWNNIISGFVRAGRLDEALDLFDEMPQRDLVSYNSLISGLSNHGFCKESVEMFVRMRRENGPLFMDEFTFVGVVGACAWSGMLAVLRCVHGMGVVIGLEFNRIVCNALMDAYGKFGEVETARGVFSRMGERDVVSWTSMVVACAQAGKLDEACWFFNRMPKKNAVSWTALIAGFVQYGQSSEALRLLCGMLEDGIRPTPFTYVSVLSACADLAIIERGKQIHGYIIRLSPMEYLSSVYVGNALIDMYGKCGDTRSARLLFERMPAKDLVSWNSLITGFSQNGLGKESLLLFEKMVQAGLKPNHVTFLGLLSSCSHTGLDVEALCILDLMENDFGIHPRKEHLTILIDLMGRKNRLNKAMELIRGVPNKSDIVSMWGALLGACRMHNDLEMAELAAKALYELEPWNAARYVMLANIYSAANRWDDAQRVRKLMEDRGLVKDAGNSWIEVKNDRHEFIVKDDLHNQVADVYDLLEHLADHLKEAGYLPKMNCLLHDDGL